MFRRFTSYLHIAFMSILSYGALGQNVDTVDFVYFEEAKHGLIYTKEKVSIFIGEVSFNHKGVYFYSDTVYRSDQLIRAIGNLLIQQGDTLSIFADSLHYNATTKQCELFGNVSFTKGEQRLYTEKLSYNTETKIAAFDEYGTFTNGPTWVKSKSAVYDTRSEDIVLNEHVFVQDPDFDIKTSKLKYNSRTRLVTFLAPTLVAQKDGTRLYCESGFYNIDKKYGEFVGNPQYQKGKDKAMARKKMIYDGRNEYYFMHGDARYQDSLRYVQGESVKYFQKREYFEVDGGDGFAFLQDSSQMLKGKKIQYDKKKKILKTTGRSRIEDKDNIIEADNNDFNDETGTGMSRGNVILHDKANNSTIHAECVDIDRKKENFKAFGKRAMFTVVNEEDTVHISADTLISFKKDSLTGDTSRIILAYYHVKIFSKSFQGVSDSMYYTTLDSIFRLYRNPVLWSDTTNQYFGDTILIFQKDKKLSSIMLQNKAMIITTPEEVYFNQISGKEIRAIMADDKIHALTVDGNARTVFYNRNDQEEYTGVNTLDCSHLRAVFDDGELSSIKFYKKNDGKYYPMNKANHAEIQLSGFKWDISRRPVSLQEMRADGANVMMFTLSDKEPDLDTQVVLTMPEEKPVKETSKKKPGINRNKKR